VASLDRREVVRVGGAAAFGAIAAWLTAGVSPVSAGALAQGAPIVDRLTVSVVIDSYQIAVAPDVKVGNVIVRRFGFALERSETRNVLIDFGYTPEAPNNNIAVLTLDPGKATRSSSRMSVTTVSAGSSAFSIKTTVS
jgi:7,8-dihydropterin-6-yl-methyl-4-(beta-D-ribofuranosyl)aminobenzene 5'-phosphate synthase